MLYGGDKLPVTKAHQLRSNLIQDQLKKNEAHDDIDAARLTRYRYGKGLKISKSALGKVESRQPFQPRPFKDPYSDLDKVDALLAN